MNNKGQSLIIFIVLIPVIFVLFIYLYDLAYINIKNNEYKNTSKSIIKEVLLSDQDNKTNLVKELYELNKYSTDDLIVSFETDKLTIKNTYRIKGIFDKLLKRQEEYKINITAYKVNDDIIIDKNKERED